MSTVFWATKKCAICNNESEYAQLGSTNCFGYADLDMRPPEMQRSTICYWVEKCPNCGYVSSDISKPIIEPHTFERKRLFGLLGKKKITIGNDDGITKELLSDTNFKNCDGIHLLSQLAKSFYQYHLLLKKFDKNLDAFFALRNAAWACDDSNDVDNAIICRLKAVEQLDMVLDTFGEKTANFELIKADMLRRCKEFERVISEFGNKHYSDELLNKIVAFQISKAKEKDDACYTVEDVQNLK